MIPGRIPDLVAEAGNLRPVGINVERELTVRREDCEICPSGRVLFIFRMAAEQVHPPPVHLRTDPRDLCVLHRSVDIHGTALLTVPPEKKAGKYRKSRQKEQYR